MPAENKDSVYFKRDQDDAIRDFGDALCGDEDKKADVFFASCHRYFTWSGGRLWFKNINGETIKATDPSVAAWFKEEYKFLMPTPKAEAHEFEGASVTIDPATVESALGIGGKPSLTSKGTIARAFGADGTNSPASQAAAAKAELFLRAEATKRGSGQERDRDDSGEHSRTDDGKFVANGHADAGSNASNPFLRLRRAPALDVASRVEARASETARGFVLQRHSAFPCPLAECKIHHGFADRTECNRACA